MKWLEDELELNALHNPGSRRGSGNEKDAVGQRAALSAALGGRVEVAAMNTISGSSQILYYNEVLILFFSIPLVFHKIFIFHILFNPNCSCSV